ncbi:MAG TPA: hypothetical protein VGR57_06520 [Ktedonobacterales bacterium]|nr:hypothetical protein [Ktedonobacterales bacterium]
MNDDWKGARPEHFSHESADELERQARETLGQLRARFGELGGRVRRVVERAGAHWEASAPVPTSTEIAIGAGERARALARRWVEIDFLVDPDLPGALAVHTMEDAVQWRVEVRERGESRTLSERAEPFRGEHEAQMPTLVDVWAYDFPVTPEIDAGERRERLPSTGGVYACADCGGSGRSVCAQCEGQGTEVCARCRGSARVTCPRCRGRGRISVGDHAAPESASHLHRHAERIASEAGERIIEFAERLREDLGLHHRRMPDWLATHAAAGDTVPCPECEDGTQACDCDGGRRACAACGGSGRSECQSCKGTGRVVRFREIVRRFDTRVSQRAVPLDGAAAKWAPDDVLARGTVELAWQGSVAEVAARLAPEGVPAEVWGEALALASVARAQNPSQAGSAERRVLSTVVSIARLALVRMEYSFGGSPYVVVVFGASGRERFWAESFPHRWSRISRFMRALTQDLGEPLASTPAGQLSDLAEHRARRVAAPEPDEPGAAPNADDDTPHAAD